MITLKINTADRTSLIDWKTFEKKDVLTREPDTCRFSLAVSPSQTYQPAVGDTVEVKNGSTVIFGGTILNITEEPDAGGYKKVTAQCKDWSHTLDRKLVAKVYNTTNQTLHDVVADILTNFTDGTFTMAGVANPGPVLQKIVFNYCPVTEALNQICTQLGNYDWYIDENKDIHLFAEKSLSAPFALSEDNGNLVTGSFKMTTDYSQIRNHVIVKGGSTNGQTVTNEQIADGAQTVFFVGYSLDAFVAQKALAATPTTWVTLNVGIDGVDDPAGKDCLYNKNDGLLIFPAASKPAANDRIKTAGQPIYKLLSEKMELGSMAKYGEYQYMIIDERITNKTTADQRATAELTKYANPSHKASFTTYSDGLHTGQSLGVNLASAGISLTFKITAIRTTFHTPSAFRYDVELLASEDVTIIDLLKQLTTAGQTDMLDPNENATIDRLYSCSEEGSVADSFVVSKSHNMQIEGVAVADTPVTQPVNYPTEFVLGPYVPNIQYNGSDHKRQFLLDNSPLC